MYLHVDVHSLKNCKNSFWFHKEGIIWFWVSKMACALQLVFCACVGVCGFIPPRPFSLKHAKKNAQRMGTHASAFFLCVWASSFIFLFQKNNQFQKKTFTLFMFEKNFQENYADFRGK